MGRHAAQAQYAAERIASQLAPARCHAVSHGPLRWPCVQDAHPLTPHAHYYRSPDVPDGRHDDDKDDAR